MGLTRNSVGINAIDSGLIIQKNTPDDRVIALAGNPNVGKSTVFNGLTGMKQHTGNWPGKTVTNAQGHCCTEKCSYVLVDLPGTYSLMAHSAEEEVARNFICFGMPDATIVVCDANCLERNFNLVLQTMEISPNVIVCVNMMDEAQRKHIRIDLAKISDRLGVPVIGITARKKKSLSKLMNVVDGALCNKEINDYYQVEYPEEIEKAISMIEPVVIGLLSEQNAACTGRKINSRWLCIKLLEDDESLMKELNGCPECGFLNDNELAGKLFEAREELRLKNISQDKFKDMIVHTLIKTAEEICNESVVYEKNKYSNTDRRIDKILTGKLIGYPVMIILLMGIFWLTITGANYPSKLISDFLFWVQDRLTDLFMYLGAPDWLHGALILGVYRVLAWVVSVMLPPMAIFFPLFTLLEDAGYLPRVSYNLDRTFRRCRACGKQALTMCMGFGCNAAGIVGCRIIDSPRERLLAILTNNFVPCNGRFPALIAIIIMFFVGLSASVTASVASAAILTGVILVGILTTFAVTGLLSGTILRGVPSAFTLELPPYRRPQIGKVIIRSIFDRILFVLGRAIVVAVPAGLIIWIFANVYIGDISVLNHCASFLNPFAKLMGLDGIILMAFILGFPANELVIPIIIMAYMAQGSILEPDSLNQMRQLFVDNGWTWRTAVSTLLFFLMHWPCSTTLLTIRKETGSWKWTGMAALIPTVLGIVLCMLFTFITKLFV